MSVKYSPIDYSSSNIPESVMNESAWDKINEWNFNYWMWTLRPDIIFETMLNASSLQNLKTSRVLARFMTPMLRYKED